ncbi:LOW QUALITY PROTEIN: monocarboxylate transporter 6-like [Amphiura filiformis]|uniref:LOW QUALITY PROTEIN: monocarboxylate transporter 6-like n=1 Tax=Amphiura filiformis TaxID=82378 RepID=UPI003B221014
MTKSKDNATSWVVLGIVTFSLFLEVGVIKSFSVLLPAIKEQFETYTWVVGSAVSIILGWGSVIGLSASVLVNRFGPRVCLMMCGLVSTIGLIICSVRRIGPRVCLMMCGLVSTIGLIICACAPNSLVLLLGLILTGFLYLQEIVAIGVIPQYFDKYYNTAVAVYLCGSGFGIILMPLLTQIFLDIYGWRGALLLLSGLCLHSLPCGAMLYQNQTEEKEEKTNLLIPKTGSSNENDSPSNISKLLRGIFCSLLLTNLSFIAQVLVPAFAWGYTLTGWLIYIVSFSLSNGTTMREASIVGTCGGIGLTAIRVILPPLNQVVTYKQLMYTSSLISAFALALTYFFNTFIGMCLMSVFFGAGVGILGVELYIAIKETTNENEYLHAVALTNLLHGFAALASGFITGWLFDMTGSFVASFGGLAAISLLTTVSLGFEDIWNGFKNRNRSAAI